MSDDVTPRDARSDGQDFGAHADRAAEIGLLAYNLGAMQSLTADFSEADIEYEQVAEYRPWSGEHVTVYRYERDGDVRWAAGWSERVAVDDLRYHSLVFDREPDVRAVEVAAEIVNARGSDE